MLGMTRGILIGKNAIRHDRRDGKSSGEGTRVENPEGMVSRPLGHAHDKQGVPNPSDAVQGMITRIKAGWGMGRMSTYHYTESSCPCLCLRVCDKGRVKGPFSKQNSAL
jgi:hypothetical protein